MKGLCLADLEMFAVSWARHLVFIGTPAHGAGDALFLQDRWRVFNSERWTETDRDKRKRFTINQSVRGYG